MSDRRTKEEGKVDFECLALIPPVPECQVPATVLASVSRYLKVAVQPANWRFELLTTTSPTLRIGIDGRTFILKESKNDRKDILVSLIFDGYGVAHHQATAMTGGWILMQDAGPYTLESWPRDRYCIDLFNELGKVAASALLLGMRDRKLGNIAVSAVARGGYIQLSHIDYEGAFRAGLFNRFLRPQKYYRYLLTRLLFDVAHHFGESNLTNAFSNFLDGFRVEWARLAKLRPAVAVWRKMRYRERLILRSGLKDNVEASVLLQQAFDRLVRSDKY